MWKYASKVNLTLRFLHSAILLTQVAADSLKSMTYIKPSDHQAAQRVIFIFKKMKLVKDVWFLLNLTYSPKSYCDFRKQNLIFMRS